MTARRRKTETPKAKLAGHVLGAPRTLALKSERTRRVAIEPAATQAASDWVDRAAAAALVASPAVTGRVRRELAGWAKSRRRSVGIVAVDIISVPRHILCQLGIAELIDERFSVVALPLQALETHVRRCAGEESAAMAEAAGLFQNAAEAGLAPAVVFMGTSLVVFGGIWPLSWAGGPK